jgi:L-lactate dehydrogenase complex protein LldG
MATVDAAAVAAFCEQVPATGAVLHRCATVAEARAAVAQILSELDTTSGHPGVAATGLALPLMPGGLPLVTPEQHPDHLDLAVSTALLGIAETGSVLLAPRTRWDRLLGVLARVHVVAVAETDVRASLDDIAALAEGVDAPYLSLVTGPTRTADIERVITIGAHGPAVLHVLLLGEPLHA